MDTRLAITILTMAATLTACAANDFPNDDESLFTIAKAFCTRGKACSNTYFLAPDASVDACVNALMARKELMHGHNRCNAPELQECYEETLKLNCDSIRPVAIECTRC